MTAKPLPFKELAVDFYYHTGLHKICLNTWYRTPPSSFTPGDQATVKVEQQATTYYNRNACPLPDIQVRSQVALHNPRTKLWGTYGEVIAIGPYRQCTIKTSSEKILIRNWRFVQSRVSLSSPRQPTPVIKSQEQQSQPIDLLLPRESGGSYIDLLKILPGRGPIKLFHILWKACESCRKQLTNSNM